MCLGEDEPGPLSEGSFMMGLRQSRRSVCREVTPDSYQGSDNDDDLPEDEHFHDGTV